MNLTDDQITKLLASKDWMHCDPPIGPEELQALVAEVMKSRKIPHCVTCQCNRVHSEMPLDKAGNPRKRSWHVD